MAERRGDSASPRDGRDLTTQHSVEGAAPSHDIHQILREAIRKEILEEQTAREERSQEFSGVEPDGKRKREPTSLSRSRVDDSSLIIRGDNLRHFRSGSADFLQLLTARGLAYFDRTRYISVLDGLDFFLLFFRPRRFGKTLTVNMLEVFHGIQYKHMHGSLYQGLDVQKDINDGTVTPGQYFILKFDFSTIDRCSDVKQASQSLKLKLNRSIERFYKTYSRYWDGDMRELGDLINKEDPADSLQNCVTWVQDLRDTARGEDKRQLADVQGIYLLVDEYDAFSNSHLDPYNRNLYEGTEVETKFISFWATVKLLLGPNNGITRAFITGILPLSLAGVGSGFNVARNISFDNDVAGLCGLTRKDIEASLKKACDSDTNAYKTHLSVMARYYNGYHFCNERTVDTVYNTETCLNYLQTAAIEGKQTSVEDPPNSEVSIQFLNIFSASPSVIHDFQEVLKPREEDGRGRDGHEKNEYQLIQYTKLRKSFTLADLSKDIRTSEPAWRSLLIYFGALTFYAEDPGHFLKIPNAISARRIGEVVLQQYELLGSLDTALGLLELDGNIRPVLACYRRLMVKRDVGLNDFGKNETIHRDSFYFSLILNHFLQPHPEFPVTRASGGAGRADLILPLRRHLIVSEWKVAQIDFLDIPVPNVQKPNRTEKASTLSEYTRPQVLQLKYGHWDKYHPSWTMRMLMEKEAIPQLKDYIQSNEVVEKLKRGELSLRAFVVLVVGSRHILVQEMGSNGELIGVAELLVKETG